MCVKMEGMETGTPTAVTSTRVALGLLTYDNIHLHLLIINKISMHFYELSPNSHNNSTHTGKHNE